MACVTVDEAQRDDFPFIRNISIYPFIFFSFRYQHQASQLLHKGQAIIIETLYSCLSLHEANTISEPNHQFQNIYF